MISNNKLCPTIRKCLKLDNKEACLQALGQCVRHTKTDEEIYKIFCFRIKILVLYGEGLEALPILEHCIGYYKSIDNMQKVTELIKLKKSIINIKGAK